MRVGGSATSAEENSKAVREKQLGREIALIRKARKQLVPAPPKALRLAEEHLDGLMKFDSESWEPLAVPPPRRLSTIWANEEILFAEGLSYSEEKWEVYETG